jgi:hypothetical protein
MSSFWGYVRRLALTYWLGMMLFFTTIFAPTVFKVLPRDMAGELQSVLFPLYYKAGLVCSFIITLSIIVRARLRNKGLLWTPGAWDTLTTSKKVFLALLALIVLATIFGFCLWVITPELNELRNQMKTAIDSHVIDTLKRDFDWFHRASVILNALAILLLMILLGFF